MSAEDADLSNMGRCDVCGEPIDMRDAGDELVTMEQEEPPEGFTEEDVVSAMVDALRACGTPEDHALADAYEEEGSFVVHQECFEKTSVPDFPTTEGMEESS